ncbi:MAG: S49 family peptidase [Nannocystaceae bacterium]
MTTPRRARFTRFLTVIGALTTGAVALVVVVALFRCATADRVESNTVLELDLERPIVAHASSDPLARLTGGGALALDDVVNALDRASGDPRVVGVVARIGGTEHGMATTQELRDAIAGFRGSGKFAIAYAETFGEFGPGNQGYYLATAFDEIWLQPSGDVGLSGLVVQSMFLRGALDKLDAAPRMDHRYEYKNAKNMFTERGFTPAHREAMGAVLRSMSGQLVEGIAAGRRLDAGAVAGLVDRGPFLGQEAVDAGLVDRLGYRDEVMAAIDDKAGAKAHLLYAGAYLGRAGRPNLSGKRIALVFGTGSVSRGASSYDPVFGGPTMGSDTVAGALRQAIDDPEVAAILFRVDSPGGSYVASDAIWRETVRAKAAGKPVIVSMGDVAGSGGYFVAMSATKIVAHPGTITGSIGVLGGKILTRSLWEKLGVTWEDVHVAANATMWSNLHDYDARGWERFQAWLDRVYADFTAKVAEGRGLPLEEVQKIARGRIWTGADAQKIGLVDELGGYAVALRLTREALELPADAPIEVKVYPEEKGLFGALLGGERENSGAPASTRAAIGGLESLAPVAQGLRDLGLGPGSHGVLSTPALDLDP